MRIAFLTPSLTAGGYEQVVVNYANELATRGHHVTVLTGGAPNERFFLLHPSITVVRIGVRARSFIPHLTRFLREEQVDFLYSGPGLYGGLAQVAKRLARSRVPLCASNHGFAQRPKVLAWILGRLVQEANVLSVTIPSMADFQANQLGLPRERFLVLSNPVQVERPRSRANRIEPPWPVEDHLVIAVAGRLARVKRVDIALRIFRGVLDRTPAKLLVVGDGPERDALTRLVTEMGLEGHVWFVGLVDNPMDYLALSSVLLHTAESEGFGNVIVEALSLNVPVVCTACAGPSYIIEGGRYGILIGNATDSRAIPEGVEAIMNIAEERTIFTGLRDRAMDFCINKATDQLESLIYAHVQ